MNDIWLKGVLMFEKDMCFTWLCFKKACVALGYALYKFESKNEFDALSEL